MAPKAHESVKLVDFHIINATINAVNAFQNKRNAKELRDSRRALEDFPLDDCKVSSLNGKHE